MGKVIGRIIIVFALFFGLYFGLSQINWVSIFEIKKTTQSTEEKFGDLIWQSVGESENVITRKEITAIIDSLVFKICDANYMRFSDYKIHIVEKTEVNAFALPNNHLIIYSGLIQSCENEEELCGVISHELAHLQLNHVMKKMVKEVGLATIVTATTGNGSNGAAMEALRHLTSSTYDRSLEEEADLEAVNYLIAAKINPEPFANFMYKLSSNESELSKYTAWVNTHPNSAERSEYIITYSLTQEASEFEPVLSIETWDKLQMSLSNP